MLTTFSWLECVVSVRCVRGGVVGVLSVVLVVGVVSPVWAGESSGPGGPGGPSVVELGSFGVGDGLEGVVNEGDGSFGVSVPVAGLGLGWDSRVGVDRYGLGVGWGFGFAVVDVAGGVWVRPSSGGVFQAAESVSSGLLGYTGSDVVFRQTPGGVLSGRVDGVVGAQPIAFELHELGGVVTYFNAAGDPVARVSAGGDRSDWTWAAGGGHRLVSVVGVDGVVTGLDWSDPGQMVVRPGVNVSAGGGGAGVWRVVLVEGWVGEVVDPVGGRSLVGVDRSGRVDRVVSGSGATTTVVWRSDADGVSRVDRVGVADRDGTELSARSWRQVDGVLPSGWPAVDPAAVNGTTGGSRSVEVSDGKTRVVSEFDQWGRVSGKRVVVSSGAGERVVQEQELTYPESDPVGVGDASRKPVAAEVRFLDGAGGVRAGTESYTYDEAGRMVSAEDAAGRVVTTSYAQANEVTVTGPDGVSVTEVRDVLGRVVAAADGTRYEWDAMNRQTGQILTDGTRINTAYWADGTRKSRVTAAGSTTFYWDDTTLLNDAHASVDETVADGVASYLVGASRHARITHPDTDSAAGTRYYSTDRHGNVTGLTDETGNQVGSYTYSDYGVVAMGDELAGAMRQVPGAVGQLEHNPFQYALEYTHADGTQFLRERTYDPAQLGFTSKDVESLHDLYGYTNANPIMLVDPSGRASQMDALTLALNIVGIVGGVLGAIWTAGAATFGMAVLGIAARTFSLADAVFTAAETYAIHTDTKFMPDEAALGLGVGLAVAGLGLGVAAGIGKLSGRTTAAIPDGVHINAGRKDLTPNPQFVEPATTPAPPPFITTTPSPASRKLSKYEKAEQAQEKKIRTYFLTEVAYGKEVSKFLGSTSDATGSPQAIVSEVWDRTSMLWQRQLGNKTTGVIGEATTKIWDLNLNVSSRPLSHVRPLADATLSRAEREGANRVLIKVHEGLAEVRELTSRVPNASKEFKAGLELAEQLSKKYVPKPFYQGKYN
ncbi:RHS repeat domain-containing protein [Agromyces aerolatus]|uniref:RHS repeat domain-containing protein n=1 Tax=Agromyces sp. LY-1074 TaxID=3074080 RepID=UPI0028601198|nr:MULTISPECIES: RHS repeat-associated core domain-containing protein [unclassified Agromyces]MDR5699720.1 RHS repeat-associated core domain-containing protein [Agromyces sp. LY-1074]MDR5706016.1 RHS repeat-associated core domain-containing protein [Agromyces sp. LY-1358]